MVTTAATLPLSWVRAQFPALSGDWIFMDNAGGSQILQRVVDRINEFLITSNVQLGASYEVSQRAGQRVQQATEAMATLINAADPSEVVLGPSTTLLLRILSIVLGQTLRPGDQIIVTNCDHEANIGCWMDLRQQGIEIQIWRVDPVTLSLDLEGLERLLTPKTRLVAVTHASNVLGTIHPIRAIADRVHAHGALICVDGVAYAPHRLVDVQALDVDFYGFSFYKVYGPHQALLYGKREHLLRLPGINHNFIDQQTIPYKFQPGNVNFELSYGLLGLWEYLSELATGQAPNLEQISPTDLRQQMQQAFDQISVHEQGLADRLLSYLTSCPQVRILGCPQADRCQRVPTISFVVEGMESQRIPSALDPHQIGIRYGDFYAKRLIEELGLEQQNGVVRVSMVHYNTLEEVDRLIEHLQPILER